MHKISYMIAALAAPLAATTVSAQEPAEPAASNESQEAAETAAEAATTTFTDEQVAQFAEVYLAIDEIQADETILAEEKQAKMAAAVSESGLDASTYNAIATAVADDAELEQRIVAAVAAQQAEDAAAAQADDAAAVDATAEEAADATAE